MRSSTGVSLVEGTSRRMLILIFDLLLLQFTVRAADQGYPSRTTDATVSVTVERTQYRPEFRNTPYAVSVNEDAANGTAIFTVSATKTNIQGVMTYVLAGIDPAPTYFGLAPTSGTVTVIGNLKSDRGLYYTVSILLNIIVRYY